MQIEQFHLMNYVDKEESIWLDGIFLANYDEGNTMCDVYQLFNFYVAFCYELHRNEKASITAHILPDELPLLIQIKKIS
ncbi:MAG: hypothetical protein ABIN89_01275 [Chitinophagaceae bacterium]